MPFSNKEELLVVAVLKQLGPQKGKIDFLKVAEEIGISGGMDDRKAAAKRWSRFKKERGIEVVKKRSGKAKKEIKNDGEKETIKTPETTVKTPSIPKKRKLVHNEVCNLFSNLVFLVYLAHLDATQILLFSTILPNRAITNSCF